MPRVEPPVIRVTTIELLLLFRRRKRLTRRQCAARLGVTPRALRSWEEGTRNPTHDTEQHIRRFLARNS